jgi:hypothetical protein
MSGRHSRNRAGRGGPRRRCFLLGLALAAVPFAFAAPAAATPPTVETFHDEGTSPWTSCEGFDIVVNFQVNIVERTFYDSSGAPVRIQAQIRGSGELVNTVTGASNTGSGPIVETVDLRAGTITQVGLLFHNNLPGEGVVALAAGTITFDLQTDEILFSAGPHPEFDDIDWCSLVG